MTLIIIVIPKNDRMIVEVEPVRIYNRLEDPLIIQNTSHSLEINIQAYLLWPKELSSHQVGWTNQTKYLITFLWGSYVALKLVDMAGGVQTYCPLWIFHFVRQL